MQEGKSMSVQFTNEPMLDMYIFETSQMIEQLEHLILSGEEERDFSESAINEIFRIMHTVKGSSAMMMFHEVATLAHTMEDIFYFLREKKPQKIDCSALSDFVLDGVDFMKVELEKIKNLDQPDGNASDLIDQLKNFLVFLKKDNEEASLTETKTEKLEKEEKPEDKIKQFYIAQDKTAAQESQYENRFRTRIFFQEDCGMENIRAYTIVHNLGELTDEFYYIPADIIENESTMDFIKEHGFTIFLKTNTSLEVVENFFQQTIYLKNMEVTQLETEAEYQAANQKEEVKEELEEEELVVKENPIVLPELIVKKQQVHAPTDKASHSGSVQSIISVGVNKLDKLMDLVGEMVIAEAMVTQNSDLDGLELGNFQKAAQQLNKITSELQDIVMSIRMVPIGPTFQKMHRIVRDMCKQLGKEVRLEIRGEDTEVDKNIIEHISDPLMHLVRNSVDHGIENTTERATTGKDRIGTVTLEATNIGSDVQILVRDDGKGLNKDKIIQKAKEQGLLHKKPEEMTDREIFNLIFLPGFSTKEKVTEFSGRGVGMDVVAKNIEAIGGTLSVDSLPEKGTEIVIKIPLTLAIIDGMNIKVGTSCYTVPIIAIQESLRPKESDLICDPDGNEMLMIRGQCYPILRLHDKFHVETTVQEFTEGIMVILDQDGKKVSVFADELLGQQQVVVKSLPEYLIKNKKIHGLAGCTLLGNGTISLILDVNGLMQLQ